MNPKSKRTHIALDADLIEQGLRVTGIKTRRELVDFALRELLRRENQKKLLELKGQVEWENVFTWNKYKKIVVVVGRVRRAGHRKWHERVGAP